MIKHSILIPLIFLAQTSFAQALSGSRGQLARALEKVQQKNFESAAVDLFDLSRRPELLKERAQIQYVLGLSLVGLNLNQLAAFQFTNVVRSKNPVYTSKALEQLSIAADKIGDESLLKYAISKVDINAFPKDNQDMLNYRLGEFYMSQEGGVDRALFHFGKIAPISSYYERSQYLAATALASTGKALQAAEVFRRQFLRRKDENATDDIRVAALMGSARSLYQAEKFDKAQVAYRLVPRDHKLWHDSIFESSWNFLRTGKFRSAVSQFQTIHSDFYEQFYQPESLLLRGIVYLYVCQYQEMEKTLSVFDKTYGPISKQIAQFLNAEMPSSAYYDALRAQPKKGNAKYGLPEKVRYHLTQEGDVSRMMMYIQKLFGERKRLEELRKVWGSRPIGAFNQKIIEKRIQNTYKSLGEAVRAHLIAMRTELKSLNEQSEFLKFEMFNAQKNTLKAELASELVEKEKAQSEKAERQRSYYIKNGFEYWPFEGEFWLDELGNYHYLGSARCGG